MQIKNWRSVQQILLACGFDRQTASCQIEPVLRGVRQSLPNVQRTLLTCEPSGYELEPLDQAQAIVHCASPAALVGVIGDRSGDRGFDAAIVLTAPAQSPYVLAYLCYLAGVPLRIGQSSEFGGGVLSTQVTPLLDVANAGDYHLPLLRAVERLCEPVFPDDRVSEIHL